MAAKDGDQQAGVAAAHVDDVTECAPGGRQQRQRARPPPAGLPSERQTTLPARSRPTGRPRTPSRTDAGTRARRYERCATAGQSTDRRARAHPPDRSRVALLLDHRHGGAHPRPSGCRCRSPHGTAHRRSPGGPTVAPARPGQRPPLRPAPRSSACQRRCGRPTATSPPPGWPSGSPGQRPPTAPHPVASSAMVPPCSPVAWLAPSHNVAPQTLSPTPERSRVTPDCGMSSCGSLSGTSQVMSVTTAGASRKTRPVHNPAEATNGSPREAIQWRAGRSIASTAAWRSRRPTATGTPPRRITTGCGASCHRQKAACERSPSGAEQTWGLPVADSCTYTRLFSRLGRSRSRR
jgi:hypothetical protein